MTNTKSKATSKESQQSDAVKIKGKLMWPKLFTPDTSYEHKWTTDVLLDKEGLKEAKAMSLRVKHNPKYEGLFDGYSGDYIRVERTIKDRAGEERTRPIVKDKALRDFPSTTMIGNGTDAYVRFFIKTGDAKGNEMSPAEAMKKYEGYGMFLLGVQILDLVPYEKKDASGFDREEDPSDSSDGFDEINGDELPFQITPNNNEKEMNLFKRFKTIFIKDYYSITAHFDKMLKNLDTLLEHKKERLEENTKAIEKRLVKGVSLNAEIDQASKLKQKISDLIS